jgi:diguanylate cyclase (GGDEF)-like protein
MTDLVRRSTRVLLVEEEPENLDTFREAFSRLDDGHYQVEWVGELSRALQRLSLGGVDVVILDLDLPDSQGLATFERANAFASDDDLQLALRTVQAGAQDYLVEGRMDRDLLVRSIRYAIERHRLLSALRSLSLIDDLTGLYNRRGFLDLGEHHLKLARRSGRPLTLFYLDLDQFKSINDSFGHHVGDRGLVRVADLLRQTFRRSDLLARLGGDEFAALALEASGDDVRTLVGRLRNRIRDVNATGREPFRLSASIGIARYEDGRRIRLDELLARADAAMYSEKRQKLGDPA